MCDPFTLVSLLGSVVGGAASKPSTPKIPPPPAVAGDAVEDTGAEIALGGSQAQTNAQKKKRTPSTASQAKTGSTGLAAGSGSGIEIL